MHRDASAPAKLSRGNSRVGGVGPKGEPMWDAVRETTYNRDERMADMKRTKIAGWLALAAAAAMAGTASAGTLQTTKGNRLTTDPSAAPRQVAAGERLVLSCPMAKESAVVTVRDIDSKGRITVTSEGVGRSMPGCKFALRRGPGSKETALTMVCKTHDCAVKCRRAT